MSGYEHFFFFSLKILLHKLLTNHGCKYLCVMNGFVIKLLSHFLFLSKGFNFCYFYYFKSINNYDSNLSLLYFCLFSGGLHLHVRYDDDKKRGRSFKEFSSLYNLIIFILFFLLTDFKFFFRAGTFIQLPLALNIPLYDWKDLYAYCSFYGKRNEWRFWFQLKLYIWKHRPCLNFCFF